jgi:hypothetical protein
MNEPEDTLPALVKQVHDNAPPGTQAIIGESALTGGGGADGTTNGFVSVSASHSAVACEIYRSSLTDCLG